MRGLADGLVELHKAGASIATAFDVSEVGFSGHQIDLRRDSESRPEEPENATNFEI